MAVIPKFDNESEVEQKFILQLITSPYPKGLGYSLTDFKTKLDLRKIKLDKGAKEFIYYPDYLIIMDGLPILIIEAKRPGEDLNEALREARLYATAINSSYSNKLNPCYKVIATDGMKLIASYWDDQQFKIEVDSSNLNVSNPDFYNFLEFCKKDSLLNSLKEFQKSFRKDTRFLKPVQLLGGSSTQNSSVGENSFGANLSIEYSYLFNPETEEEKKKIVENAYVGSKTKLNHVNSIDKVIRSIVNLSDDKTPISDTEKPEEIINTISDQLRIKNKVLLLVGSVGAGKSTFTTYLKEVILPDAVRKQTYWVTFNMNNIPGKDLIFEWLLDNALSTLEEDKSLDDIYDFENLTKIFGKEISSFNKLAEKLLDKDGDNYKSALFNKISELQNNKQLFLKGVVKFLFTSRRITPIFILDNVDKKDKDTQLLMFEAANWIVSSFNCTVFLPLRDETYENYRDSPPLDTVIKDFVFKIEPPLLESVIYKRFEYLVRSVGTDQRSFHYILKNGSRVECKRGEVINYIGSILKSLFQNQFFKRLMIGLAGKDTRRGLEIFLDFCKSGHIPEEEIFKMRFTNDYELPNYLVSRILLKGTRKYYSDSGTKVKNLFHSYVEDEIPDPFVRLSILRWLKSKFYEYGPNKTKGYHKVESLLYDLSSIGHSESRINTELESLIRANCIIAETQSDQFSSEDLISITSTGFVHLDLLFNIDYLSSVSEDTYFRNLQYAEIIKDNIAGKDFSTKFHKENTLKNAVTLIQYLDEYKNAIPVRPENFLENGIWTDFSNLQDIKSLVETKFANSSLHRQELAENSYPPNTKASGQIVILRNYGVFVEFGLDAQRGFAHVKDIISYFDPTYIENHFEEGQNVDIEIIRFNKEHQRFDIRIV